MEEKTSILVVDDDLGMNETLYDILGEMGYNVNNILNNVKNSAELISTFLNNPEELKDTNEMLDIIKDQVSRGAKLISNVRKISQLEEGEISIKSMDVCKVLNEAKEFLKKR